MYGDVLKKYYEKFEQHTGTVALFIGVLPFVAAFLVTTIFANGHVTTANYVLQEIGVYQIWTMVLVYILQGFLQIILTIFLLKNAVAKSSQSWHRTMLNGLVMGIIVLVIPLSVFIGAILGWIIARLILKSKLPDKVRRNRNSILKYVYIYMGVYLIFTGLILFPQVPYTKITLDNNQTMKIKILSDKNDWYLALGEKTKQLINIRSEDIKKRELCKDSQNTLSLTLSEYLGRETALSNC